MSYSSLFSAVAATVVSNDPARKGEDASARAAFGVNGRFVVYAVHTRFDAVQWFVEDTSVVDDYGFFQVIRQDDTLEAALYGLPDGLTGKYERFGNFGRFALTVENDHLVVYDAYVCDDKGRALPVFSCLQGVCGVTAKNTAFERVLSHEIEMFDDFMEVAA